jgi:hypothetical protein
MAAGERRLLPLPPGRWEELHRLMVAQRFPAVPPDYREAVACFVRARIFGLDEGSKLLAAFVFGAPQDDVSFLDVVCAPHAHGLWATAAVLRELYDLAFNRLGLRVVWVQPRRKAGLKAALQAGFVPGTPLGVGHPVLVMTPFGIPPKFLKHGRRKLNVKVKGEPTDGQFI